MFDFMYRISEDGQQVTLQFPGMVVSMTFSAHQFGEFIESLARLQSRMMSTQEQAVSDLIKDGSGGGTLKRWLH